MTTFPKRKNSLAFNRLNDQMIIIDFSAKKQFHQVSEIGAIIFELCDGNHSLEEIENLIFNEYDVPKEELHLDIMNFLTNLKENGLIDY